MVEDGRERDRRRFGVVLGESQCRKGGAHLTGLPALVVQLCEGPFSAVGLAHPHEQLQQVSSHPRRERVRDDEQLGERLGRPESTQRRLIAAASQLEASASAAEQEPSRWFHLHPKRAFGAIEPRLGLLEPSLADHRVSLYRIGNSDGRLLGPAVPSGQLDRLPAPLRSQRERRPNARDHRPGPGLSGGGQLR